MAAPGNVTQMSMEVRSFRVVFALERRIHRVDRFRIPLPYGVPVRAAVYAFVVLVLIVLAGRLPAVGELVQLLPAPLRLVALPIGVGFLLSRARVDGRPAHRFLVSCLRHRAGARHLSAFRPIPAPGGAVRFTEPIAFVPDWRRVVGPARLRLTAAAELKQRRGGAQLVIRPAAGGALRRSRTVCVDDGGEVIFRR
jgi:hypothetical protein